MELQGLTWKPCGRKKNGQEVGWEARGRGLGDSREQGAARRRLCKAQQRGKQYKGAAPRTCCRSTSHCVPALFPDRLLSARPRRGCCCCCCVRGCSHELPPLLLLLLLLLKWLPARLLLEALPGAQAAAAAAIVARSPASAAPCVRAFAARINRSMVPRGVQWGPVARYARELKVGAVAERGGFRGPSWPAAPILQGVLTAWRLGLGLLKAQKSARLAGMGRCQGRRNMHFHANRAAPSGHGIRSSCSGRPP